MEIRREKAGSLPPKKKKESRWQAALDDLRTLPMGESTVITLPEKVPGGQCANIEKLARIRGMNVKAQRREKEIWIEKLA